MDMLLAADLRMVAKDAYLLCGFLRRGRTPGRTLRYAAAPDRP
jgi:enoyl-CoA hydratase/carnithine racemase